MGKEYIIQWRSSIRDDWKHYETNEGNGSFMKTMSSLKRLKKYYASYSSKKIHLRVVRVTKEVIA